MEEFGEYSLKRKGTAYVRAKLMVSRASDRPEVNWLNGSDKQLDDMLGDISNFLSELAAAEPSGPYSIAVEEFSFGSGSLSLEMVRETLRKAFANALSD